MLLAYGTSITAGHHAFIPSLQGFPAKTAQALKCDHLNFGCSGSAYLDAGMADYLATLPFRRATLCLSVNMISAGYSVDTFKERATYLIRKLHQAQPQAHIACISILPYFRDWDDNDSREIVESYRSALKAIVEDIASPGVAYLHGPDILKDLAGLSVDMIHPTEDGFAEIATHLVHHFLQTK